MATIIAGLACGSTALAEDGCDLDRGQSLFSKCAICHTNSADADHAVGPNLFGIIGRAIAASPDYVFTEELKAYGDKWSLELLDKFLASPMTEVPGTTMAFGGFRKEADRKNLLCFLGTINVEGAVGRSLSDTVRGRVAGRWEQSDGYVKAGIEPFGGTQVAGRTTHGADGYAIRGSLQIDASDN